MTRPRLAIVTTRLGIPSEVWIERQCQALGAFEASLIGWDSEAGWPGLDGVETLLVPGGFAPPGSLLRRVREKLGLASARALTGAQIRALGETLDRARPDIVLAHFAWNAIAVAQVPLSVPLVWHVHGRDASALLEYPSYRAMIARHLPRADALVAVGAHQIDRLRPYGLPARHAVIPCGAPLDLFAAAPLPDQQDAVPLRFVSVGRMSPEKGMVETIHAFDIAAHETGPATLTLIGDGPEMAEVRAARAASPFAEHITLTGRLAPTEIAALLARSHVYLQHSRPYRGTIEGFGVTLTEAGAAGLPLLASRVGGLIDQIEEGQNGFFFATGDSAGQAALMVRLARDAALRTRLGTRARELAARFDVRTMARRLETLLLETRAASTMHP